MSIHKTAQKSNNDIGVIYRPAGRSITDVYLCNALPMLIVICLTYCEGKQRKYIYLAY